MSNIYEKRKGSEAGSGSPIPDTDPKKAKINADKYGYGPGMHSTVPVGQDAEAVLENAASTEEDKAEANAGGERLEGGVEAAQQSAPLAVQLSLAKGVAGNCREGGRFVVHTCWNELQE